MKYTDWRLPKIQELISLVDYSRDNPAINTDLFPDTQSSSYWSSNTTAYGPYGAWIVYFDDGSVLNYSKDGHYYVRAVRNGFAPPDDMNIKLMPNGKTFYTNRSAVFDPATYLVWSKKTLGPCTWDEANRLIAELNKEAT